MVTKIVKKPATTADTQPTGKPEAVPLSDSVKDSAQQIWQAGLGAFALAQAEGSKAFEALVQEGVGMQRKTQTAAEERIAEATKKMSSMASEISSKATGQWDKLETIFEDRVAKALAKLGVPSAKEVEALVARLEALDKTVQELSAKVSTSPAPPPKATPGAAPRAAARKTAAPAKAAKKPTI